MNINISYIILLCLYFIYRTLGLKIINNYEISKNKENSLNKNLDGSKEVEVYFKRFKSFQLYRFRRKLINENELIKKMNEESLSFDEVMQIDLLLFKKISKIFMSYLKKQQEWKQEKIIFILDKRIIKENISEFYHIMGHMKYFYFKFSVMKVLKSADLNYLMKHSQEILDIWSPENYDSYLKRIIEFMYEIDNNFIKINIYKIFYYLLLYCKENRQREVIYYIHEKQPDQITSNIDLTIDIMTFYNQNYYGHILELLLNIAQQNFIHYYDKIIKMIISSIGDYRKTDLLIILITNDENFISIKIREIFKLFLDMKINDCQKTLAKLLVAYISEEILNKLHVTIEKKNTKYLWNNLKEDVEPSPFILILLIKLDPYMINRNKIDIKKIINKMDHLNYKIIIKYIPIEILETKSDDKDCAICLEKIQSIAKSDWCTSNHGTNGFHYRCIEEASKINNKCPLCRGPILLK